MFSFAKGKKEKNSSKEKRKNEEKDKVRDEFQGKEIADVKAVYQGELEVSQMPVAFLTPARVGMPRAPRRRPRFD